MNHKIARAKLTFNDPCPKYIQNPETYQNHDSKKFPTLIQLYVLYIQICLFYCSNNLLDNGFVDL